MGDNNLYGQPGFDGSRRVATGTSFPPPRSMSEFETPSISEPVIEATRNSSSVELRLGSIEVKSRMMLSSV